MSNTPICIIKGKKIPGWVYGKLYAVLGEHGAGKALYKARKAKDPANYALKGLKEGWIGQSTSEMDYNKTAMEDWISRNIHREAPTPKRKVTNRKAMPDKIGSVLEGIL